MTGHYSTVTGQPILKACMDIKLINVLVHKDNMSPKM